MNLTIGKLIFGSLVGFGLLISCSHFTASDFRKPAQASIISDATYFKNSNSSWFLAVRENLNQAFLNSSKCIIEVENLVEELPKLGLSQIEGTWFETDGKLFLKRSADLKFQINGRMSAVPLNCRESISSFFTKLRDLDDYIGERAYKVKSLHGEILKFDKEPVPILQPEKYNAHFINPKLDQFKFEPGDVMITRGISFISAAIAQSTKQPSKFSHGVFVHVNKSGVPQTIESYINSGVKYYSIEDALKNENARIMIFRSKDKKLALAADKTISRLC